MIDVFALAGNVLVFVVTALMWSFVVLYGVTTRWEATEAGRGMLAISLITSGLLTLGCVRILVGSHPALTISRTLLYAAVLLALLYLLRLYMRTQCTARDEGAADADGPDDRSRRT